MDDLQVKCIYCHEIIFGTSGPKGTRAVCAGCFKREGSFKRLEGLEDDNE